MERAGIRRPSEGGSVRCVSSILSTITSANVVNMLHRFADQSPLYRIVLFSPPFGVQFDILTAFSCHFAISRMRALQCFIPKLSVIYLLDYLIARRQQSIS